MVGSTISIRDICTLLGKRFFYVQTHEFVYNTCKEYDVEYRLTIGSSQISLHYVDFYFLQPRSIMDIMHDIMKLIFLVLVENVCKST